MRTVELVFIPAATPPDVLAGDMAAFIVITKNYAGRDVALFSYYLNEYPLSYDDGCDVCRESGVHEDGCPTTGWFYDNSNFDFENCYYRFETEILEYAPLPVFSVEKPESAP